MAKLLLNAGSIPNLRDDNGDTPLIIAARTHNVAMAKLLLENGICIYWHILFRIVITLCFVYAYFTNIKFI